MTLRNLVLLTVLFAVSAGAGFLFYETMNNASATPDSKTLVSTAPGLMRPDFSLNDVDGNKRSITEWDGKALVVNFWATWCAPCLREIPLLIEMQQELASKDIQFIGIAIDNPAAVSKFAEKTAFNYPILVGEQEGIDTAEAFGADVVALPMTVFTDHAGNILELHAGEITRAQINAALKRVAQKKQP